ncbi:MAG TPA: PAS domain S-box protein, partial [Tepidisphaeraceae bacterium]
MNPTGEPIAFRATPASADQPAAAPPDWLFKAAFTKAMTGMALADLQGRLIEVNPAFCRLVGRSPDELIGRTSHVYSHPDDAGNHAQQVADVAAGRTPEGEFDTRYIRPDGSLAWAHLHLTPALNAQGRPGNLVIVAEEVTEQHGTQAQLQESQERLSLALSIAQMGTFEIDLLTDAVTVNADGRAIYGWPADEALTFKRVQSHFHPADRDRVGAAVAAAFDPAGPRQFKIEQRIIRTDRVVRWIRVWGRAMFKVVDGAEQAVRCIGTYIDISEEKDAQDAVRDSMIRFRELADSMPQIVFTARADGHVDYFNRRWYEYTGFPENAATGDESWAAVHEPGALERVSARWLEAIRTGEEYQIEYRLRRRDGAWRWHLGRAL